MGSQVIDRGNAAQESAGQRFVYDGRLGQIYGIFIKNLLLGIITLGFYRFWGKTNLRRYIWSHVSLQGDHFEYTGTGGELFKGFLIVVGLFFVAGIVKAVIAFSGGPASPQAIISNIVFALLIFYLIFVARYAAQRYRLTRTLWRGISGGMTGSAWLWGFKAMFFAILSILSLTLAWPWTQMRLTSDRLNNSFFGDAKANANLSSVPVYWPYLAGILASFGGLFIVVVLTSIIGMLIGVTSGEINVHDPASIGTSPVYKSIIIAGVAGGYIAFLLIAAIAFSFYQVAVAREVANKLSVGGLRFATPITVGRLIRRYVGNILIIIFTLGLGLPIAIHRTLLFLAANIEIIGEIEGSEITRAELPRPKFGEGLLEAFDPSII